MCVHFYIVLYCVIFSGRILTIGEARNKGILDADLSSFRDLRNDKVFSIQEAIDNKYLVATLDNTKSPTEPPANGEYTINSSLCTPLKFNPISIHVLCSQ